jgi:putative acetyltransferase
VKIVVDDLSGPEISEFLAEHVRQMRSITPLESKHALDLDALRRPGITFWSVLDGGTLVGCGAIKRLDASHAEVKSMRTAPARHRSGIASLLLGHVIAEAGRMGFARLSLETGSTEFFRPARNLYEKFGFEYCGPFGDYRPDPNSVFMTRTLPLGSARRRPPQGPRCQPVRRKTCAGSPCPHSPLSSSMTSSQFSDGRQSPSPRTLAVSASTAGHTSRTASSRSGAVSRATSITAVEPSRSSCSANPATIRNLRPGPGAEPVRLRYSSAVSRRLVNT